jgi:predicted metal-dependent peptidase
MADAALLARIRAAEDTQGRLVDDLVQQLLDEHGEVCSSTLADAWIEADPDTWRSRRYRVSAGLTWLRAAEERGELTSELRPAVNRSGPARRWFWRPEEARVG